MNKHPKGINKAEKNGMWKGDSAKIPTGRVRAEVLFPEINKCEVCGVKAVDRHHKDGNTLNNKRSNIMFLCRKCHMKEDGRILKIGNYTKIHGQHNNGAWKNCTVCGRRFRAKKEITICYICEYGPMAKEVI